MIATVAAIKATLKPGMTEQRKITRNPKRPNEGAAKEC